MSDFELHDTAIYRVKFGSAITRIQREINRMSEFKAWQRMSADRALEAIEQAKGKERQRRACKWIATNGEDLSGHDFGCEYVWVCYDRAEDPGWGRQLWKAGDEEDRPIWEFVTHYMLTDIRTPEPPE